MNLEYTKKRDRHIFPSFFSTSFSFHNFVNFQPIYFKFSAYDQDD